MHSLHPCTSPSRPTQLTELAPAGWILLSIFNLLLIAAMSTHPEQREDEDFGGNTGKHGPPPAASHPMRPMSSRGGQSLGSPTIPTTSV